MGKTLKEQSRADWNVEGRQPDTRELMLGCLQRIADSNEIMAKSRVDLEADRDWYKKRYHDLLAEKAQLERSNRGLRAWITRLKNKVYVESQD